MVEVVPGVYDGFVAGAAWAVLRLEQRCMGVRELAEELQRMGLEVRKGRLNRILLAYEGRVFSRMRNGSKIVYCAEERV